MSIRIFTIPFDPAHDVFQDDELRAFLLNKHIRSIRPEFFQIDHHAYWSVFVEYAPLLPSDPAIIDDLNEPQQLLFRRLQEWRKETAQQEGIPVYIIATNRQLLNVVRSAPRSPDALRQIQGFGKKKVTKYGQEIVHMITAFYDQKAIGD